MFTALTIAAAWFAFGYSVTDLFMTAYKSKQLDDTFRKMVKRETE